MATNYYYIDDDPISTIQETAKGLSTFPEKIRVLPFQHSKWEDQIKFLIEGQNNFDGILFDWGLINKNENNESANFNVEALAQQIRRSIIEKKGFKKDFPIVLCSAQYRFKQIFDKELSSHDLFDAVFEKDDFDEDNEAIIGELFNLAEGYKILNEIVNSKASKSSTLNILKEESSDYIDYRVFDYLKMLVEQSKPNHEIARFLLTNIIRQNGILIDEYLLASRLGVDILNIHDNNSWDELLSRLSKNSYKGVFGLSEKRWWMSKINHWWDSTFATPLGSLNATERVGLLNKKFKITLIAANKTEKSKSDYFWTICKETMVPLAIEDSILLMPRMGKPAWIEDEYFSIDYALENESSEIHFLEKEKMQKLKKMYTKIRKK